jgi:hypothetical protein
MDFLHASLNICAWYMFFYVCGICLSHWSCISELDQDLLSFTKQSRIMKIDEKNGKPEMYENGSLKGKVD